MTAPFDAIPDSIKDNPFLRLDENARPANLISEIIADFFNQGDILQARSHIIQKKLGNHFPMFSTVTRKSVESLDYLIEQNPPIVQKAILEIINDKALLTKLLDIFNRAAKVDRNRISFKLDFISDVYEVSEILRFPVFLLVQEHISYEKLPGKEQIISHLKSFGLTRKNIENIRLIRNAVKHKYQVQNDSLVTENGEKISISEVNILFDKLNNILTWYTNFLLRAFYLIPKFGLLLVMTLYYDLSENESWEPYINGLKQFFSNIFDKIEEDIIKKEKKKKTLKYKLRRVYKKSKFFIIYRLLRSFRKSNQIPKELYRKMPLILDQVYFQFLKVSKDIEIMANKLETNSTQSTLLKFSRWLNEKSLKIKDAIDYCRENPDKIIDILEHRYPPKNKKGGI